MPRVPFNQLPDHGRLWVFPASRDLSGSQRSALLDAVDTFLDGWAAHGHPLLSARSIVHDRFLVVGVDVDAEAPSGCSIDALVNQLRSLESELGVSLIDHSLIWYRDGDTIEVLPRGDFRARASEGNVGVSTVVFDPTLTTVGDFRAGALERPAGETWHARAFFRDQLTG